MSDPIWHDADGRAYQLVNPTLVRYDRYEKRRINGRMVTVKLPPLEYTVVRAELIGNETMKGESIEP